jgi:hypothetical protein
MLKKFRSAYSVLKFFIFKKDCKVVYFKLPSSILPAYLDYNLVEETSNTIKANDKSTAKLAWLIQDLKVNEFSNPIQLLQSGDKYFCHPGTARILVNCYILNKPYVVGFYLWYPKHDIRPFILDYEYKIISNPFEFLMKFKFGKRLLISTKQLTDKDDESLNHENNTTFKMVRNLLKKTLDNFDVEFLTFYDGSQWDHISGTTDLIFENENTCWLAGIKFNKINDLWVLD